MNKTIKASNNSTQADLVKAIVKLRGLVLKGLVLGEVLKGSRLRKK